MSTMTEMQQRAMESVLEDVARERRRQHALRGQQELPHEAIASAELEVVLHQVRERQAEGVYGWTEVVLEEAIEAAAEPNLRRRRVELVQLAASAVQEIEAIDRNLGVETALPAHLRPQPRPTVDARGTVPDVAAALLERARTCLHGPEQVQARVVDDISARAAYGRAKHGTPLQAHNGRDHEVDEYQELLDAAFYAQARAIQQRTLGNAWLAARAQVRAEGHLQEALGVRLQIMERAEEVRDGRGAPAAG